MVTEGSLLLCVDLTLLLFHFLLLLNDAQELIALSLSLLGQHDLALDELPATRNIEILGLDAPCFSLLLFLPPELAFTFFESSLRPEGIDLTLAIGSPLLELA